MSKMSNGKNSIYGTMPRNQHLKVNNGANVDGISGSVNEESGSVLSSMCGKSLSTESSLKAETRPEASIRAISKQVFHFQFEFDSVSLQSTYN